MMNKTGFKDRSLVATKVIAASLACCALCAAPAMAQNGPLDPPTKVTAQNTPDDFGFRTGSIVAAPIPFESPSLGSGLAVGGAYLFKSDLLSDTSSIGFGGFKSSNDSFGYGVGLNLAWDDDRWTLGIMAAEADLNYDLYLNTVPFAVNQKVSGARIQLAYSPLQNYSVGGNLAYGEYSLRPRSGGILPPEIIPDVNVRLARISGFAEHDTRDDTFYPTQGSYLSGTFSRGEFVDAGRDGYSKLVLLGSAYKSVFDNGVVAAQVVGCSATKNAPFFDACSIGQTDSFRGYVVTKFIDDALFSLQAEYRGHLVGRLGYVIFAGAGAVGGSFGSAVGGTYQSAAGVGLRIRLSKDFPLDYAIDYSVNDQDEKLLYISVGQRF